MTVEPYVVFGQKVKIGNNSHIKSFSHIEKTKIDNNVVVGPYARLRLNCFKDNIKLKFYRDKNLLLTRIKVNHLSYMEILL